MDTHPADHACGHCGSALCAACRVRSISVCAALSADELAALAALARDSAFPAGAEIVAQGGPAAAVLNITGGTVRMTRQLPDGRRQILGFLLPGDFLGLSFGETYGFSAEAVDGMRACRFERRAFEGLLLRFPHLLRRLLDAASSELALTQEHLVLLGRANAAERVAAFLLGLRRRRQALGGDDARIDLPMTRQDIADHLGLTIETVSRTLTKLAGERLIAVEKGGIAVRDPAALDALAAH